ncbi:hypothetical protein CC2G_012717 [Coprinopsis cinerea AmutBmut pab1-1]|nr:hypothetical protein CC2G_012717 [Coprinopsis cinerea AmutBmut pab1-1]
MQLYSTLPSQTRVSTSSTKTLSDFALIRRRKSTGSRPSKSRSNSHPTPPKVQTRAPSSQSLVNGPGYEVATPKTAKSISSTAAVSSSDVYWHGIGTGSQTQSRDEGETTSSNTKFSTADRTILEELKRNLHARDAQFVMKGVGVHLVDGTISPGKKHHPYTTKDVPYPRSYEREVIDLDVWETLFCQDICESLTWHVFEEPPLRVERNLDSELCPSVEGLDIVPLHPDLQRVGSSDFASRITWVQANFLDGLPFPNDEFDFVHIKRIALGVPEDKWDALFDEISRVMKPGGALEMVEEDLFFPGKPVEHDDDETDMGSALSRSSSIASTNGRRDREVPAVIQEADGSEEGWLQPTSPNADSLSLATPTPMSAFPRPSSRPGSPKLQIITNLSKDGVPDDKNDIRSEVSTTPPGSPKGYITLIPPHSRSTARPLLYVKPQSGPYNHQFPSTSPPKPSSTFTNSAVSLLNSLTNHSHSDSDNQANLLFRRRRSSTNLASCNNSTYSGHAGHGPHHTPDSQIPETPKIPPFLLRTPAKAPNNPRDHSLLEYIYNETLSSRFINTSPIALLATYLEYHFKDTRTHPPLMFTFPPRPVKPSESDVEVDEGFSFPPKKPGPIRSVSSRKSLSPSNRSVLTDENGELTEENRWLNMQGLMTGSSPYVSLDGVRYGLYALSPAPKATFTTQKGIPPSLANMEPRIPNKTLNIDLRTLNLHLMLRAKEILACSETMWEWVRETQLSVHENPSVKRANGRAHSMDVPHAYRHGASDHRATVLEMSREDFNQLLLNFEMDMEDQASINHALRERLQWSVIESAPSQNRKIFNTACEKYEKWFRKEASITSLMRPVPPFSNPTAPEASSSDLLKSTRKRSNSQTLLNRNGGPPSATSVSPLSLRLEPSVHFAKPSIRPELHPTQKLSRSMSVFVAWKPEAKGKS